MIVKYVILDLRVSVSNGKRQEVLSSSRCNLGYKLLIEVLSSLVE